MPRGHSQRARARCTTDLVLSCLAYIVQILLVDLSQRSHKLLDVE